MSSQPVSGSLSRVWASGGEGLRVLVLLPVGWPALPTGAFVTSHEFLSGLSARGHEVVVVATHGRAGGGVRRTPGGYGVFPFSQARRVLSGGGVDVVVSHHGDRRGGWVAGVARQLKAPHVLLTHGMSPRRRGLGRPALVWFNSHACRRFYSSYRGRAVVSPPPVNSGLYRTTPGDAVVLSGSSVAKGVDVVEKLARRLPKVPFVVAGNAGASRPAVVRLPNVEWMSRQDDPRNLYSRARVVLMPSTTEAWGRVGVEAGLSGIPTVASDLPGIREALGSGGIFLPRTDIAGWTREVERLMTDQAYWTARSQRALANANGYDYDTCVAAFCDAVEAVARRKVRA